MGKLIVTTGNYAKTGYCLKKIKRTIYSIEELCYFIRKNPELCEDYLYEEELAQYLSENLGLKELGLMLTELREQKAPVKDLVAACFYSCDYFTIEEIEEFLREQTKAEKKEPWILIKRKADSYLAYQNFLEAIFYYRQLLKKKEDYGITSEVLGDIYHNLAIALLYTEGFTDATDYFREAFKRNHREESLHQYLLALRFSKNTTMYTSAVELYQVPDYIRQWLDAAYAQTELEVKELSEFDDLMEAKKLLEQGKRQEFYKKVTNMTETMKEQYRNYKEL